MARILTTLAALALAVAIAVAEPQGASTKTQVHLTAEKRASADILWDDYGVPHIFAENLEVLAYAYGYAQARDHSAEILRLLGIARGRAAEYWGTGWRALDISTWSSQIPQYTKITYDTQDPQSRIECDAFAAGFTKYLDDHPEELDGLGPLVRVLPIAGVDVLGAGLRAYYSFSYAGASGLTTSLAEKKSGEPDTFKERFHRNGRHYAAYVDWFPEYNAIPAEFRSALGSNGWAINEPKASGSAKLDMNPHLPFGGFFRWYEAHFVVASLDIDIYGTGFVGLPNLQIAFTRFVGWTHTVNTIQPYTAYELSLVGDNQYYFDGQLLTLEEEIVSIKIRQDDGSYTEEEIVIEESVHGPISSRAASTAYAIRLAGLDRPDPIKQWWDMGKARNLTEFKQALAQLQISMFSVIGATQDGDIFHSFNGFVPVRSEGDWSFWRKAAPGDSSRYLWTDIHPFEDLPYIENPPLGWVQNANEPPWTTTFPLFQPSMDPTKYPAYMAPSPSMGYRPQVSARLLDSNSNITFEKFVELKHSTLKEYALKAVPELLEAIDAYGAGDADLERVATIWSAWDLTYDTTSRGAVLFDYWIRAAPSGVWQNRWSSSDPLGTPNTLANPQACVDAIKSAVRQMRVVGLELDVEYGQVHRLPFGPRPDNGLPLPGNGDTDTFRNTWYGGSNFLGPVGGDSWVCVVEFNADGPRAQSLIGYGNASPGSRGGLVHVNDQFDRYSRKELKPVRLARSDIEANLEESVRLSFP
jgi:acyl-homoserine-lactone acylase